jgi:hypothetical protein
VSISAIAGVGSAVAIGSPARVKTHEAFGGTVLTRTSNCGGFALQQPARVAAQTPAMMNGPRIQEPHG